MFTPLRLLRRYSLCVLLSAGVSAAAIPATARLNFLFIQTDDMRFDAMGVVQREQGGRGRFPWFKTPNMDRLAAEGARFRNAFVTNSLCSPSRAVTLTGRYSHLNGIANNHTPFPLDSVTQATVLRGAGYKTGYIGKWHMGPQSGQRPGFDYSASFVGQGRYDNCPFEINGVARPTTGWVDDVSTNFAIDFLRANRAGPFLLMIGFKTPHGPRTPPDRLKNAFTGESCRPAVNEKARPPYLAGPGSDSAARAVEAGRPDPRLDYFRCIAGADENLGRLLAALEELGLAGNTVVVFTSDNGYYLGDHGLGDKRSAYEESLRVPLLVRDPTLGRKGMVVDEPVLNLDHAPTFITYAGLTPPAAMQGLNWGRLLRRTPGAPVAGWRTSFFYEYFFERNFAVPTIFAVRTEAAKLVRYPDHPDWTEVFNLTADPYEMRNLAADPAEGTRRVQLEAEYDRQAKAVDFRVPDYADKPAAAGGAPKGKGKKKRAAAAP